MQVYEEDPIKPRLAFRKLGLLGNPTEQQHSLRHRKGKWRYSKKLR